MTRNKRKKSCLPGSLNHRTLWVAVSALLAKQRPCWLALLGLSLNAPGLAAAAAGAADAKETGRDRAHYSADEPVNFQHMRLRLTFTQDGLKARACEGRVEYTLKPLAKEADTVRLDAVDMRIL